MVKISLFTGAIIGVYQSLAPNLPSAETEPFFSSGQNETPTKFQPVNFGRILKMSKKVQL